MASRAPCTRPVPPRTGGPCQRTARRIQLRPRRDVTTPKSTNSRLGGSPGGVARRAASAGYGRRHPRARRRRDPVAPLETAGPAPARAQEVRMVATHAEGTPTSASLVDISGVAALLGVEVRHPRAARRSTRLRTTDPSPGRPPAWTRPGRARPGRRRCSDPRPLDRTGTTRSRQPSGSTAVVTETPWP